MKHLLISIAIALIIFSSCSTLIQREVRNIEKTRFEPLQLKPAVEANNFRIDLIRETETETTTDSTQQEIDKPYHPMGFDLGNGLFFDASQNLCIRIDYLLNFSPDYDFELIQYRRPKRNASRVKYSYSNASLNVSYPPSRRKYYQYQRNDEAGKSSWYYKRQHKFTIKTDENGMTYGGKRRKWDVIKKQDEQTYYLNRKRRSNKISISGNEIQIQRRYVITMSNDQSTIEIKNWGRGRNRTIYTLVKSDDKIIIYDKYYNGRIIKTDPNTITLYKDKEPRVKYELIERSAEFDATPPSQNTAASKDFIHQ